MKRTATLPTPRSISVDRARHDGVRTLDELSETASAQKGRPAPRSGHDGIGVVCVKAMEVEPAAGFDEGGMGHVRLRNPRHGKCTMGLGR